MWKAWAALAACIVGMMVMVSGAPEALAQAPPVNITTLWVLTDQGKLIELEPPDLVPTTDVVSSPYVEFQRIGGLVANGGRIAEAGQYNQVGTGPTYIIDNWSKGTTYGIPNGAPLGGEMRLSPEPHLHLRTPVPLLHTYWPSGIDSVEIMTGNLAYSVQNHSTHGEYYRFEGSGRALVKLNPANNHYAINMVCTNCMADTPAVVGSIPDDGFGNPVSNRTGTTLLLAGTAGACSVDGVNHTGCGDFPTARPIWNWPLDPRPSGTINATDHSPILEVTRYDITTCPGANQNNTEIEAFNDAHFRMVSQGCVMQSYDYQWWDGNIQLNTALPLRAGFSTWENTSTHPTIVMRMDGGAVLLQAYVTSHKHHAEAAFDHTLTIIPGILVDSNTLVVLHDAFNHLGAFTSGNLPDMATLVQTYPQRQQEPSMLSVAHGRTPNADEWGGLQGAKCTDRRGINYEYCITVFDNRDLPVVHNARGIIYDARSEATLNAGSAVDNHWNVFGTGGVHSVPYDSTSLNLIQAYAVIPITGSINVEEIYVMASALGGCSRYVDTSTTPHSWAGPASDGWLGLDYLKGDYGSERSLINIPLLPYYGIVCMRTSNSDEFRQFMLDDFFVQGAHASFGGTRYVDTRSGSLHHEPDAFNIPVLHTDVVLPGNGTRVLDLDLDLAGAVRLSGVAEGRGGIHTSHPQTSCDWDRLSITTPPRHTSTQRVEMYVQVMIEVPGTGGYQTLGGLSVRDSVQLTATRVPETVGEDCRHVSHAGFDFDPEFRTIPIVYSSNMPVRISITTNVDFSNTNTQAYAGVLPKETMFVETIIDRLVVKVH